MDEKLLKEKISSKEWRLNHLYSIVDKSGNKITFKMNAEQRQIWDECYKDGQLAINPNILKARQLGITTFFVLSYLDDALWNENLNCFIQSHDQESIKKIFRIVRYAYRHLPEQLRPDLDKGGGSMYEYYFPRNNSRIYVGLENRSSTVHRLHLSEAAFQDKKRITATLGALPPGICYSTETTPEGMNWYFDDWVEKRASRKDIFFPWFNHHAYKLTDVDSGPPSEDEAEYLERIRKTTGVEITKAQLEFRRQKIIDLKGEAAFDQEFPSDDVSCFVGDLSNKVVPEAIDVGLYIGCQDRPELYDPNAYFDLGFVDYMGGLWGYLDFQKARLVIEREYFEHYKSTGEHVEGFLEVEEAQGWLDRRIIRIGDCSDKQQLYDMSTDHGYAISPIQKKVKHGRKTWIQSVINTLRVKLSQGALLIDEENCPNLLRQLKYGCWNEHRTDFERTEAMGHLDLLVVLGYFCYDLDWSKNPYGLGALSDYQVRESTHHINRHMVGTSARNLTKLIGG